MSTHSVEQLQHSSTALRNAFTRSDWQALVALDLECRDAVERAMADPHQSADMLRDRMQELLALYREIVGRCQVEQQAIADELRQIQQSKNSAKVYQMFG